MSTPEITTTTRRSIVLDEEQVKAIPRDWARQNHSIENPEFDFDCESYGIRAVEIFDITTSTTES